MSNPPSLEQIVAAVLSEHDGLPTCRLSWPPSVGLRLFSREDPPAEVQSAMLDFAHGQGGLLAVLVPDGSGGLVAMTGEKVVEAVTRWADRCLPGCVMATWHGACQEGDLALIEIAEAEPGTLPGPGEMDLFDEVTLDVLDPRALRTVLPYVRVPEPTYGWLDQAERDGAAMLEARIAVRHRSELVPTVAGLLAFGARPYQHIPGAKVVLRFGRGHETVRGSLAVMAQGMSRHPLMRDGLDARVVRELVLNALVHRDWSKAARSVPVLVTRTSERLEVTSPGSLRDGVAAPNPVLRDLLRKQGLVPAEGHGVERVERDLRRIGAEIRYAESRGEVRAIVELPDQASYVAVRTQPEAPRQAPHRRQQPRVLMPGRTTPLVTNPTPSAPAAVAASRPVEPEPTVPVAVAAEEPVSAPTQRGDAILALLAQRGEMASKALAEALGWSRSTVRDTLTRLVEQGRIQRLASSPRSPEQSYAVRER